MNARPSCISSKFDFWWNLVELFLLHTKRRVATTVGGNWIAYIAEYAVQVADADKNYLSGRSHNKYISLPFGYT